MPYSCGASATNHLKVVWDEHFKKKSYTLSSHVSTHTCRLPHSHPQWKPCIYKVFILCYGVMRSEILTTRLLIAVEFVWWCIQEQKSKDIEVPHAVDPSEEGTVHLNRVVSPMPMTFIHLPVDTRGPELSITKPSRVHNVQIEGKYMVEDVVHEKQITAKLFPVLNIPFTHCFKIEPVFRQGEKRHTWLMMKKMTVIAAHARVTSIRNLKRKIRPWEKLWSEMTKVWLFILLWLKVTLCSRGGNLLAPHDSIPIQWSTIRF